MIASSPNADVVDLDAKREAKRMEQIVAQQIGKFAAREEDLPNHVSIAETPTQPTEVIDQGPTAS